MYARVVPEDQSRSRAVTGFCWRRLRDADFWIQVGLFTTTVIFAALFGWSFSQWKSDAMLHDRWPCERGMIWTFGEDSNFDDACHALVGDTLHAIEGVSCATDCDQWFHDSHPKISLSQRRRLSDSTVRKAQIMATIVNIDTDVHDASIQYATQLVGFVGAATQATQATSNWCSLVTGKMGYGYKCQIDHNECSDGNATACLDYFQKLNSGFGCLTNAMVLMTENKYSDGWWLTCSGECASSSDCPSSSGNNNCNILEDTTTTSVAVQVPSQLKTKGVNPKRGVCDTPSSCSSCTTKQYCEKTQVDKPECTALPFCHLNQLKCGDGAKVTMTVGGNDIPLYCCCDPNYTWQPTIDSDGNYACSGCWSCQTSNDEGDYFNGNIVSQKSQCDINQGTSQVGCS